MDVVTPQKNPQHGGQALFVTWVNYSA